MMASWRHPDLKAICDIIEPESGQRLRSLQQAALESITKGTRLLDEAKKAKP